MRCPAPPHATACIQVWTLRLQPALGGGGGSGGVASGGGRALSLWEVERSESADPRGVGQRNFLGPRQHLLVQISRDWALPVYAPIVAVRSLGLIGANGQIDAQRMRLREAAEQEAPDARRDPRGVWPWPRAADGKLSERAQVEVVLEDRELDLLPADMPPAAHARAHHEGDQAELSLGRASAEGAKDQVKVRRAVQASAQRGSGGEAQESGAQGAESRSGRRSVVG